MTRALREERTQGQRDPAAVRLAGGMVVEGLGAMSASTAAASLYLGSEKRQGFSLRKLVAYMTVGLVAFVLAVNAAYTISLQNDIPLSKGATATLLSSYQHSDAGSGPPRLEHNVSTSGGLLLRSPPPVTRPRLEPPQAAPAQAQEGISVAEMRRQGTYVLHMLPMRVKRLIDNWQKVPKSDPRHSQMWSDCAIVGNSGAMLGQGHGAEIDRHAMVLRLNNSPNKGHEADVGAKTTVSLINGWRLHWCGERPTCPCWPYGIDVALMAYVWEPFMLEDIKLCRSTHPNALILVVDKELEVLANRIAREYTARRFEALKDVEEKKRMRAERQKVKLNFSTGLLGIALSLGLCQRLSLYGFNRNASQHHFWESATRHEIPDHDYQSEADFYAELAMGSSSLGRYWPLPPTRFVE